MNKLGNLQIGAVTARLPIIQGGMGVGVSLSGLASAVAEEGGIGVISTAAIGRTLNSGDSGSLQERDKTALRAEISRTRESTSGVFGVNIMMAITDFTEHLKIAFDEKVSLVFIGAGLPLRVPELLSVERVKESVTSIVPKVSSSRAVRAICKFWSRNYGIVPDAFVVEGPEAGGHLGFAPGDITHPNSKLESIIPEVLDCVKPYQQRFGKAIPVIAAGGIFSGADIRKFLQMGASGVKMGTRFVATRECDAHTDFKNAYIQCSRDDILIIDSPVGLPGRAIGNNYLRDVANGLKKPLHCIWKCLKTCDPGSAPYCIASALSKARKGDLGNGFAFAGTNAYRLKEIVSVKELMNTLVREYNAACALYRNGGGNAAPV